MPAPDQRARANERNHREERCRVCGSAGLHHAGNVDGYDFVECDACAFVFAPEIDSDATERLYAAGYHGAEDGAPEAGWANAEFLEPAMRRLPDRPLRILDHGCGESVVPDLLRSRGHRVTAIDVAPPSRPHPDRITGYLEEMEPSEHGFDLVYSFQVFEHLPNPRPALRRLVELTEPGGLLLIHTDMETPERADGLENWWYVSPPDHCAFYRPATFRRMAAPLDAEIAWSDAKSVIIIREP